MSVEEAIKEGIRKSLKKRFNERRGKLEIIADILIVARGGGKENSDSV